MIGIDITLEQITEQVTSFMGIPVVPLIITAVLAVGLVVIVAGGLIDLLGQFLD